MVACYLQQMTIWHQVNEYSYDFINNWSPEVRCLPKNLATLADLGKIQASWIRSHVTLSQTMIVQHMKRVLLPILEQNVSKHLKSLCRELKRPSKLKTQSPVKPFGMIKEVKKWRRWAFQLFKGILEPQIFTGPGKNAKFALRSNDHPSNDL